MSSSSTALWTQQEYVETEADIKDLLRAQGCILHVETLSATPHRYGSMPIELQPCNLRFQTATVSTAIVE